LKEAESGFIAREETPFIEYRDGQQILFGLTWDRIMPELGTVLSNKPVVDSIIVAKGQVRPFNPLNPRDRVDLSRYGKTYGSTIFEQSVSETCGHTP